MSDEQEYLIDGYLDGILTPSELQRLNVLVKEDRGFAQRFARASQLHDRLHSEFRAEEASDKRRPKMSVATQDIQAISVAKRFLTQRRPAPDQKLDGVSLVSIFTGAATLDRKRLFRHFPCQIGRATPSSAVREGDFNLIEFFEDGGRRELYDLSSDPYEEHDLSAS